MPTGWSLPDVQPVGTVRNADGTPVVSRRRGPGSWALLVGALTIDMIGIALVIAGVVLLTSTHSATMANPAAAGTIGSDNPVVVDVPPGGPRNYTIWLIQDGIENSEVLEDQVASTTCVVRTAAGEEELSGAFQSTSVAIGDEHSIGWFAAPPGETRVRCGWTRAARTDDRAFVITEGTPDIALWPIVLMVAGGVVSVAATFALISALRR